MEELGSLERDILGALLGNPKKHPLSEEDLVKEVQTHPFPPLPPPQGSPGGIRAGQNLEAEVDFLSQALRK